MMMTIDDACLEAAVEGQTAEPPEETLPGVRDDPGTDGPWLPRLDEPAPWLRAGDIERLRGHWQRRPLTLSGAAPVARWPGSLRCVRWMETDRLDGTQATLWRSPGRAGRPCVPMPPGAWTRERRLGDQVLTGLLDAGAVRQVLGGGGWLHVRNLHRIDPGLAGVLSRWQESLGVPVRVHGWWGQGGGTVEDAPMGRAVPVALDPAEAAAGRFLVVIEGELTAAWTALEAPGDAPASRRSTAGAGDVLYLPAGSRLSLSTRGTVWAIELRLDPLTPLAMLAGLGEAALRTLRDDVVLRRCRDPSTARADAVSDTARLVQTVQAALVPGAAQAAARAHLSRTDEDNTASPGRLSALSRLFEATGRTLLAGRPDRVERSQRSEGGFTLVLADKELQFAPAAEAMLHFMLQPGPYRLDDAPGRFPLAERLTLARRLAAEGLVMVAA